MVFFTHSFKVSVRWFEEGSGCVGCVCTSIWLSISVFGVDDDGDVSGVSSFKIILCRVWMSLMKWEGSVGLWLMVDG